MLANMKHGQNFVGQRTPEYSAWDKMMSKCYNSNDRRWRNCGGKGIVVFERWQDASNFLADIEKKPSPKHIFTRIDKTKNWEPGNVRWKLTHGKHGSPEYAVWAHMMQRCYNPNDKKFKDYGGRGIVVCASWHDAENFLDDMGKRPSVRHTLGRIKNGGNYEPSNCQWELPNQQSQNRRSNKLTMVDAREIRMLYYKGHSQQCIALEFGVSQGTVSDIINRKTWFEKRIRKES